MKLKTCRNCLEILSDPTRAKIVDILVKKSPLTVTQIVTHFKLRQPTISHHLAILKENNFVTQEKKGLEVFYTLNCHCHQNPHHTCEFLK